MNNLYLKNYFQLSANKFFMKKLWFCADHLDFKKIIQKEHFSDV